MSFARAVAARAGPDIVAVAQTTALAGARLFQYAVHLRMNDVRGNASQWWKDAQGAPGSKVSRRNLDSLFRFLRALRAPTRNSTGKSNNRPNLIRLQSNALRVYSLTNADRKRLARK
jgi:hypothetical protein